MGDRNSVAESLENEVTKCGTRREARRAASGFFSALSLTWLDDARAQPHVMAGLMIAGAGVLALLSISTNLARLAYLLGEPEDTEGLE